MPTSTRPTGRRSRRHVSTPAASGAHREFPDRQSDPGNRERSIEHESLTPVFGNRPAAARPVPGHPDNAVTETGVLAEGRRQGVSSRAGRVDVRHQPPDPLVVGAPYLASAGLAYVVLRRLRRR